MACVFAAFRGAEPREWGEDETTYNIPVTNATIAVFPPEEPVKRKVR